MVSTFVLSVLASVSIVSNGEFRRPGEEWRNVAVPLDRASAGSFDRKIDRQVVANCEKARTPLMGWSSWNAYRVNISEAIIRRAADDLIELGLARCGYGYVNIDDGFFGGRDEKGRLRTHPERFPNGLKGLVDYIHAKGLKAGIYSDAGENTCGSIYDNDVMGVGAGFWQHEQQDADFFFRDLDYDFIKVDFGGGRKKGNTAHVDMDERERYTAVRQAIDRAKRGVRMEICCGHFPGTWARDLAGSWRVTHDIAPTWKKVKGIIRENLYLSAYAGPGAFNHMDMLEVGRGLKPEEDKTHFGMWCILSSPLLIGCDLEKTRHDAAAMALLKNEELIALNQDPLCRQAYVAARSGERYVLVKDLLEAEGLVRAVAFFNATDTDATMKVPFAALDLAGKVSVRDLFARRDLPPAEGELVCKVPKHGTRIYRLAAEKRLERRIYEAETAWLEAYQERHNPESFHTAYYREADGASGGVVASNVGGKPENYLEWRNVVSHVSGNREMRLLTSPTGASDAIEMTVNGARVPLKTVSPGVFAATVPLQKGANTIRLWGSVRLPDIDCLCLSK